MAGACNAHGVSGSAGLAQHVLESLQPEPSPYVRSLSPRRFLPCTWDWESARDQAEQVYENYYSLPRRVADPGGVPAGGGIQLLAGLRWCQP
jgi:hypothetical protein